MDRKHRISRATDFILYIAIGALACATPVLAVYFRLPWNTFSNWLVYSISIAAIFGYYIAWSRSAWNHSGFCLICGILFFIHSSGYVLAVRHFGRVKPFYLGLIPLELSFFVQITDWLFAMQERNKQERKL